MRSDNLESSTEVLDAFIHVPGAVDDHVLVVDKADLKVRTTSASPWDGDPTPGNEPFEGGTG